MNALDAVRLLIAMWFTTNAGLGVLMFVGVRPRERWLEVMYATLTLTSTALLAFIALASHRDEVGLLVPPLRAGDFEVLLACGVTNAALTYAALTTFLMGIVFRFSSRYLHRDLGFAKFFLWLGLLSFGLYAFAFSDGFDLAFIGWEVAGLSSVMLITFFRDQSRAATAGLSAWLVYRVSDFALLLASGLAHLSHEHDVASPAWLLGALVVFAAQGKSAQFPFSDWLPSAMEGPTPSSAVFYGGLAIHLGPLLLLKTGALWFPVPALRCAVGVLGALSCLYGWRVGRLRADAKSSLGYAAVSQVGLIQIELALGWHSLALAHMAGHAILRTWQILHVPGWISEVRGHREFGRILGRVSTADVSAVAAPLNGYYITAAFQRCIATPLRRTITKLYTLDKTRALLAALAIGVITAASAYTHHTAVPALAAIAIVAALESLPWGRFFFFQPGWIALVLMERTALLPDDARGVLTMVLLGLAVLRGLYALASRDHESSVRNLMLAARAVIPASWLVSGVSATGLEEFVWAVAAMNFVFILRSLRNFSTTMPTDRFHGLGDRTPRLSRLYFVTGLCLVGFPMSVGFLGEDLELHGFLKADLVGGALYALAMSLCAAAFLRNYLRLFHGPPPTSNRAQGAELPSALYFGLTFLVASVVAGLIKGVM